MSRSHIWNNDDEHPLQKTYEDGSKLFSDEEIRAMTEERKPDASSQPFYCERGRVGFPRCSVQCHNCQSAVQSETGATQEPRGCPTPGACSALAVMRENAELRRHLEVVANTLGNTIARAEAAERQLAEALKDAAEGWEAAIEWSGYAGEYFQEKHGLAADAQRLEAARARLKENSK